MENFKSIIFFIILLFCLQSFSYVPEEGRVSATFGPYWNRTNFEGSSTVDKPGYLTGMELVAVGDISDHGSLEIAMIYTPQIFFNDVDGKFLAEKIQTIHITMGYRWWHTPYISTSLALYSAYPMGVLEIVHNDNGVSQTLDTSARDKTEYGFDWAIQGEIWNQGLYAVVLEGRYSYSLTHKKDEHADQFGAMLGIRYIIQEEKKIETKKD